MLKTYERLIRDFIEKLDAVDAPVSEYREACREAISSLEIALDASEGSSDPGAADERA